jgi:hypothetical protein
MSEPEPASKLNPYAPTFESSDSPTVGPEPRMDQTVGGEEVIGNGILGVGMSGAAIGFLYGISLIAWNWNHLATAMFVGPLFGVFFGFIAGAMVGMFMVPLIYVLFKISSVRSGDWTTESLLKFAAICGLASTVFVGCIGALLVNAILFFPGLIAAAVAVPVTIRVFGPLRKMVAKRLAQAPPPEEHALINGSFPE